MNGETFRWGTAIICGLLAASIASFIGSQELMVAAKGDTNILMIPVYILLILVTFVIGLPGLLYFVIFFSIFSDLRPADSMPGASAPTDQLLPHLIFWGIMSLGALASKYLRPVGSALLIFYALIHERLTRKDYGDSSELPFSRSAREKEVKRAKMAKELEDVEQEIERVIARNEARRDGL